MYVRDYLLAIVVFGIMIAASTFLIVDMATAYNVNVDTAVMDKYKTIDAMFEKSSALQGQIDENDITAGGVFGVIVTGISGFFKIILASITLPITLINSAFIDLGLPWQASFILTALLVMLTITIVFAIVNAALRSKI